MIQHLTSTTSTEHGMRIEEHFYATGSTAFGKEILLKETFSTLAGRTLHSWSVKLAGACCYIASFRTARKALEFYTNVAQEA